MCIQLYNVSVYFFEGFCDFERDFCGWVNNPPPEFGVEWDWLSSKSDGSMIPPRDHTTGSALGNLHVTHVL